MGNRYEVSGGVTKHTDLTDKEVNGVIDHADGSVTDAKLLSGVGLNDGQIAKLPVASQGQVLTRGASAWQAQTPSGGGFNSRVRAHMSTTQSIPSLTETRVKFDVEDFDGNNEYDPTTNYRFTATSAGYYLAHTRIEWYISITGYNYSLFIRKNGSMVDSTFYYNSVANMYIQELTAIVSLAASDYLDVAVFHTYTSPITLYADGGKQVFYIHRLS
jgi:hypothetical protein